MRILLDALIDQVGGITQNHNTTGETFSTRESDSENTIELFCESDQYFFDNKMILHSFREAGNNNWQQTSMMVENHGIKIYRGLNKAVIASFEFIPINL